MLFQTRKNEKQKQTNVNYNYDRPQMYHKSKAVKKQKDCLEQEWLDPIDEILAHDQGEDIFF